MSEVILIDSALGESGFEESISNLFDFDTVPELEEFDESIEVVNDIDTSLAMTTKINVPVLDKSSSYEAYKKELNGWGRITRMDHFQDKKKPVLSAYKWKKSSCPGSLKVVVTHRYVFGSWL